MADSCGKLQEDGVKSVSLQHGTNQSKTIGEDVVDGAILNDSTTLISSDEIKSRPWTLNLDDEEDKSIKVLLTNIGATLNQGELVNQENVMIEAGNIIARNICTSQISKELEAGNDSATSKMLNEKGCEEPIIFVSQNAVHANHAHFETQEEFTGSNGYDDNLVVARSVDENSAIPNALEYDHEEYPRSNKNCRIQIYLGISVFLIITSMTVIFHYVNGNQRLLPKEEKSESVEVQNKRDVFYLLTSMVGEVKMSDQNSPQARAAEWIIHLDAMQLNSTAENLRQRYIMATFYLSTTVDSLWLSCNAPLQEQSEYCNLNQTLSSDFFPDQKVTWARWLSSKHECDWAGIYCDELMQIRSIQLPGQHLAGLLPEELSQLHYLHSLTLSMNRLHGTLPSGIGSMKYLLMIELNYNFFTGSIPAQWYNANCLQMVNIAANLISGTLSSDFSRLNSLKSCYAQNNALSGRLPTEFGQLSSIMFARLSDNVFSGNLPSELGKLEELIELWIFRNELKSTIPTEIGNMKSLMDLRLYFNPIFGAIPQEIYNLTSLITLDIHGMRLAGTLSTKIEELKNLETFRINSNLLTGTIPKEIGNMKRLKEAWLQHNQLTGEIPTGLCTLRSIGKIVTLEADCRTADGSKVPLIRCPLNCCSSCYNHAN